MSWVTNNMAAVGTLTLALLSQGDEIVVHQTLYSNTLAMMSGGLPRFGIKVIAVDLTEPANLDAVLTARTRIVYFETPVNPTAEVLDIAAIAERAHTVGAIVVVDSTFASPALQRPIELGVDLVLHSLTKYINGHSSGASRRYRSAWSDIAPVPSESRKCSSPIRRSRGSAIRISRRILRMRSRRVRCRAARE